MHLEVAVPAPLPGTFTYEAEGLIAPGSRVLVPFGPRKMVGVVTGATAVPPDPKVKVKKIAEIIDDSPIYSPVIMEIAHWMRRYYLHPLGEVLSTMLPASTSKQMVVHYELTAKGEDSADPKLQTL